MSDYKAYTEGFCKVAASAGINPVELVKIARQNGIWGSIKDTYTGMNPYARRAILTGLMSGLGTYALSDGTTGDRLKKGLLGSLIGGGAIYGLDKLGLTDFGLDLASKGLNGLKVNQSNSFIPFI